MSIINVNEIGPISLGSTVTFTPGSTVSITNLKGNNNIIAVPTGHRIVGADTGSVYSPGSVVQTAVFYSPGTFGEITTTSSSLVTTGLSVSITPKYSTSKLFFTVVFNGKFVGGSGDDGASFSVYRDGSPIRGSDQLLYRSDSNTNNMHLSASIQHYVNANSTSSTTFTLFFSNQWGGTAVVSRDWNAPMLSVMEIAQ